MGGIVRGIKTLIPAPKDGADGVVYEVRTSAAMVVADADGNVTTGAIEVFAYKITGEAKSSNLLGAFAQSVVEGTSSTPRHIAQYRIDGGLWQDCTNIGIGSGLQQILSYGIPASAVSTATQKISVRLTHSSDTTKILGYAPELSVVKNGAKVSRPYMAGDYPSGGARYAIENGWYPVVQYNPGSTRKVYWYLNKPTNVASNGSYIAPSASNNTWVLADNFPMLITSAIFSEFAHLGGAIICGDWMISQHGVIYDTNGDAHTIDNSHSWNGYTVDTAYTLFDENHPNANSANQNNFAPNYCIDMLKGDSYQNKGIFKGTIYASGGEIGGFQISATQIRSSNGNIVLNSNGTAVVTGTINVSSGTITGDMVIGSTNGNNIIISPNHNWGAAIRGRMYDSGSQVEMFSLGFSFDNSEYRPLLKMGQSNAYNRVEITNGGISQAAGDVTYAYNIVQGILSDNDATKAGTRYMVGAGVGKTEIGVDSSGQALLSSTNTQGNSMWPTCSHNTNATDIVKGRTYAMSLSNLYYFMTGSNYEAYGRFANWMTKWSVLLTRTN